MAVPPRPDLLERLAIQAAERERAGLLRRLRTVEHADGPWLDVGGRRLLSFCSNDYLGLARHPAVIEALTRAARQEGVGSTSAHLICGHRAEHAALEEALAAWTGRDRALLFSTGYMANLGVMQALLAPGDLCVQDKLNHACLLDGARLGGAELKRYRHADLDSARRQLQSRPHAALLVDDAHGLGVLGPGGAGSLEQAGLVQRDVPLLMATLGKALGCSGAFVAGPSAWIEGLVQFARTYVYTTAMPPALAAAALVAVQRAQAESWRRDKLAALVARFRRGATELGLALMNSSSAIQPLLLGSAEAAMTAMQALEVQGLLVTAIRPPTVPGGQARLRITLSASHEEAHVDRLLAALETLRPPGRSG